MNSIFAKVSASLETRRLKVQKELETMSVEIEKVDAEITKQMQTTIVKEEF